MESESLETHAQNRNKILLELKKIWATGSNDGSNNLDDVCNKMQPERESLSPTADCLIELNPAELNRYAENNLSCYRCRHFLNIPPNLVQTTCERVSDYTEKYDADLAFVQAIVWLKSAIAAGKEISTEQFHTIFRKQWDLVETIDNRTDRNAQRSEEESDGEDLAGQTQELSIECGEPEYSDSIIELLCNSRNNGRENAKERNDAENDGSMGNVIGSEAESVLSGIITPLRNETYASDCTENEINVRTVIPETDEESLSSIDIFRTSFEGEKSSKVLQNGGNSPWYAKTNNSLPGDRIRRLLQQSFEDIQDNRSESDIFADKDDLLSNGFQSQRNISQPGDVVIEDSNSGESSRFSAFQEESARLGAIGDPTPNMDCWSLDLKSQTITQRSGDPSFVLECSGFSFECNSQHGDKRCIAAFLEDESIDASSKRKNYDSAYDTLLMNNSSYDSLARNENGSQTIEIGRAIRSSCLRAMKQNLSLPKSLGGKKCEGFRNENNFEVIVRTLNESQINNKKRKLNSRSGRLSGNAVKRKKNIVSSQWLNFIFDALNTDEVVFRCVKVILSFLEDERISKDYVRRRHWENTLEKEAVNAILNCCDIFKAEKHTNMYTQEVIETVIRTLEKIIGKCCLTETTLLTSHVSIILELCNSMQVCTKVIDYLTTKLKSYEISLASLLTGEQAQMYWIVNELQLVFYALSISLQKYQLVFSNIEHRNVEEIVPAVVDLWKKQFSSSEYVEEESREAREKRWAKIFDQFAAFCSEDFVQFAEKSRVLYCTLISK